MYMCLCIAVSKKPVPVSSDMELSVMKNKIAELKAQLSQNARERSSSTSGEGFNIVSGRVGCESARTNFWQDIYHN